MILQEDHQSSTATATIQARSQGRKLLYICQEMLDPSLDWLNTARTIELFVTTELVFNSIKCIHLCSCKNN